MEGQGLHPHARIQDELPRPMLRLARAPGIEGEGVGDVAHRQLLGVDAAWPRSKPDTGSSDRVLCALRRSLGLP